MFLCSLFSNLNWEIVFVCECVRVCVEIARKNNNDKYDWVKCVNNSVRGLSIWFLFYNYSNKVFYIFTYLSLTHTFIQIVFL